MVLLTSLIANESLASRKLSGENFQPTPDVIRGDLMRPVDCLSKRGCLSITSYDHKMVGLLCVVSIWSDSLPLTNRYYPMDNIHVANGIHVIDLDGLEFDQVNFSN